MRNRCFRLVFSLILVACWVLPLQAQTQLTLWHTWGAGTQRDIVVRMVVDSFEERHPGITIDVIPNTGTSEEAREKFMVAAISGVVPDITILSGVDIEWIENGLIIPLTSYFAEEGLEPDFFFPGIWEAMSYGDDVWAAPVVATVSTLMLAINEDMFEDAGLSPDAPPKTIYELQDASRRLTVRDADGRIQRIGIYPFNVYGYWNAFEQWSRRFGARFVTVDEKGPRWQVNTPEAVAALTWLTDWYQEIGHTNLQTAEVMRWQTAPPGQLASESAAMAMWLNGFNRNLQDFSRDSDIRHSVTWLPHHPSIDQTDGIFISSGFGLSIPSGSKHPDAAWDFIKYWITSDEVALLYGETMGELTIKRDNPAISLMLAQPKLYGTFIEYFNHAQPPEPAVPFSHLLQALTNEYLPQVYRGDMLPDAALDMIQSRMDIELSYLQ